MNAPVTRFHAADGLVAFERIQDCTPVAEHAGALRQIGAVGSSDMRLAAQVPLVIIERYLNDHGITLEQFNEDPAHGRAILNDPALAAFRVWQGKV